MKEAINENINTAVADAQRPFPGLRSYEEKNKSQFGGRDAEIKELFKLVEINRLTIVFGKSGIGKTSLINAGLIPELKSNYLYSIYIRIDYSSQKKPLDQLRGLIYEKLKARDSSIPDIGESVLWEYFHDLKFCDGLLTPVVILDQFEEIFTIGKEKSSDVYALITELSDLAENRVPMVVQQKHKNTSEMISSQYGDQNYHVIISMREDYLAQLESLKTFLPSMKDSRFRVVQMTVFQAMDAVMKPANNLIEKDVAVAIINKLPGISKLDFDLSANEKETGTKLLVEPFLLSLICYEINEKRIEKGLDKVTLEMVSQFDISEVINSYYNKTMQGFSENVQRGFEDTMLTESGFRKLESLEELETKFGINNNDIQQLIEKRLIRKELRDGVEYVELIHDVLTPVIKAGREKRLSDLHEKERKETIQRAIELDKMKRKRMVRSAALVITPIVLILLILAVWGYYKNIKNERKINNIDLANTLLRTSDMLANSISDNANAALVSRTAYLINKENNGGNEIDFYNSMYQSLDNLQQNVFEITNNDSSDIRAFANTGSNTVYFGCVDGKLYKLNGLDSAAKLVSEFGKRITSLAISSNKQYLAVAGVSNEVSIIDLLTPGSNIINLSTGDTVGTGKSACFTDDGRLILRLDSKIIRWDINSWKPVAWKQKIQIEVNNEKEIKRIDHEQNAMDFKYEGISEFNCMSVFKNKIALGIDSGVIVITKDSIIRINSNDFGPTSAVTFDPSGNYLFIGNTNGTVYKLSLSSYSTELSQYQTARISGITFSSNGKYMASASSDHTTAIWNLEKSWNSSAPLLLLPSGSKAPVYCVTFSNNNDYILAGYQGGKIFKWPVNMEILSGLICAKVNRDLDTAILKRYVKREFNLKEIEKYNCTNGGKN
ncbi:MAG: AAA family ATPase [Bacteroidota bacterium]|nr:AAA family ATPase [Bacteroidota bacterium]